MPVCKGCEDDKCVLRIPLLSALGHVLVLLTRVGLHARQLLHCPVCLSTGRHRQQPDESLLFCEASSSC